MIGVVGDGRGLRLRVVIGTGLVTSALAFLALRWWVGRGGGLIDPSVTVGVLLVLSGVAEMVVARHIRRGVTGDGRRPLDALWAHRMLLVGQAAALTGAVVAGWYLGLAAVVLPDVDADSVRRVALSAAAVAVGGLALAAGGLMVQAACRIDPPSGDERRSAPDTDDPDGAGEASWR